MKTSGAVQIAALTAPVVAAVGVAWFTTCSAGRIARDGRIADKRASAYLMLGEYTVRMRQYALVANPDLTEDHPLMPPPLSEEDRYRMVAMVETYGSTAARAACDELLLAVAKVGSAVAHFGEMRAMSPPFDASERAGRMRALDDSRERKKDLHNCCERVLDLINAEMMRGRPAL